MTRILQRLELFERFERLEPFLGAGAIARDVRYALVTQQLAYEAFSSAC